MIPARTNSTEMRSTTRGRCCWGLAIAGVVVAGVYGCTAIGAGIGAAVSPPRRAAHVAGWDTERIKVGDTITVHMRSGETIHGTYKGEPSVRGFIEIATDGKLEVVDTRDIQTIDIKGRASGAQTGALIGLAVDTTIVVVVLVATASSNNGSSRNSDAGSFEFRSCPLVYSMDSRGVHLDAEVFGGALFPAARRTDLARLDHAQLQNGEVQLQVTGEAGETQHVDQMALLVAEHAPGEEIVPTRSGQLVVVSNTTPPTVARGDRGADLRPRLSRADGNAWVSNPFGRDPRKRADLRDGITLEVPRPAGAQAATLLLRVQNTPWGAYLQGKMLALQGRGLESFYREMNSSLLARYLLHKAMVREGMLQVKVQSGKDWKNVDYVWEVGPSVSREVAVPLDLSDVPGKTLRVRLESDVGIWSVDRARFAFGPPVFAKAKLVHAESVVDAKGVDHTATLARTDNSDYVMQGDSSATLTFRVAPPAAGQQQSFFVQATGWYRINVDESGPPHPELVERLLLQPGAYARFALEDLHKQTARLLR